MKKEITHIVMSAVILFIAVSNLYSNNRYIFRDMEKAGTKLQNYRFTDEESKIPVIIILNLRYDTDKLYKDVVSMPKNRRREHTVATLKSFSDETQQELRIHIEELQQANLADNPRFIWIVNVIGLEATSTAIKSLINHPDIAKIEYDPLQYVLIDEDNHPTRRRDDRFSGAKYRNLADSIEHLNVAQVWDLGYTGEGQS